MKQENDLSGQNKEMQEQKQQVFQQEKLFLGQNNPAGQ